jgi:hypothetical protein
MKIANSIFAVMLVIVLGISPVLAFARAKEAPGSAGVSGRRMRPTVKSRTPKPLQTPTLTDGQNVYHLD